MKYSGVLKKMTTENTDPVNYYLDMGDDFLNVNQLINKSISIQFLGYECLNCGEDKKIFRQGFCYDCFFQNPQIGGLDHATGAEQGPPGHRRPGPGI